MFLQGLEKNAVSIALWANKKEEGAVKHISRFVTAFLFVVSFAGCERDQADVNFVVTDDGGTVDLSKPDAGQKPVDDGLAIAPSNLRSSTILVAGGEAWENLGEFHASSIKGEDALIDLINVVSRGDAASFEAVAVAKDGAVRGWSTLPSGKDKSVDVDISSNPLIVPANGSVSFQIWAKLNPVVPGSSVGGVWDGVARSGVIVALGLGAGLQMGEWDATYAGKYNIRATGLTSGKRIYASAGSDRFGHDFEVRKTKPIISHQALNSTILTGGADTDLYKFQVAADPAGSLAVKKIRFNGDWAQTVQSNFQLCNFRIRRGAQDLAPNQVKITDTSHGTDLWNGCWQKDTVNSAHLAIVFTDEETVSGSGNVYTLHATVVGIVSSGDSVVTFFTRWAGIGPLPVTGWLTIDDGVESLGPDFGMPWNIVYGQEYDGAIIWSDLSEVPHSDGVHGSRDWTWEDLLEDLSNFQALSR